MTSLVIPSPAEIGAGISLVSDGACDMASSAVQQFVSNSSMAETGLHVLASQIEVLEQLVTKLRDVSVGIEHVHDTLAATTRLEWHSPAGQVFREAVSHRQEHALTLRETANQTATLASQGIDELRTMIASLQTLLAAARTTVGAPAATTVARMCA